MRESVSVWRGGTRWAWAGRTAGDDDFIFEVVQMLHGVEVGHFEGGRIRCRGFSFSATPPTHALDGGLSALFAPALYPATGRYRPGPVRSLTSDYSF